MMNNSNNTNFTQIKVMKRLNSRPKLIKIKKMNPNFGKTELNLSFVKGNKLNIFKRKIKTDSLLPEFNNKFSRSNYSTKNKKYPLFFRTSNFQTTV